MNAIKYLFDFRIFGVNVKAVLNVSQVVVADMIERGLTGATIVNISSIVSKNLEKN